MANSSENENGRAKNEELKLQPHPLLEQMPDVQYCLISPPPWTTAILMGFQHYLLTIGSIVFVPTILVPQMGGGNAEKAKLIQSLMFISGVNTLLQSMFGTRLSTVVAGSYAFLVPTISIIKAKRFQMILDPQQRFGETMRGIQGALILSSCFQIVIGFLGIWRNIVRFLNPLSMFPLITYTGLGLYYLGFPLLLKCAEIGIPQLILILIISQYVPRLIKLKEPICDRYAMLFSVPIVWIYATILTSTGAYHNNSRGENCRVDHSKLVANSSWINVPLPFQWGPPTFNAGEAFAMMFASLVSSVESTGCFLASARYSSATPVPPSVISRGIAWLGIGTLLNGIFACPTGSTCTVENAGLLALSRVGSRRTIQISAVFMILFSIFGKFGAIFATIPMSIMAAMYCIFFGYVASAGLGFLHYCNLNSFRTKLILGLSLFVGLSLPQYFIEYELTRKTSPIHTHSRWFNDTIYVMFKSHTTVAAFVAMILDWSIPHHVNDEFAGNDNGSQLWDKFVSYSKDCRSNEFYKLPFRLNNYFPPL